MTEYSMKSRFFGDLFFLFTCDFAVFFEKMSGSWPFFEFLGAALTCSSRIFS